MAKRITQEDIALINKVYRELGTYAATARETGKSAATVAKYVVKGDLAPTTTSKTFPIDCNLLRKPVTFDGWTMLTNFEKEGLVELKKELSI